MDILALVSGIVAWTFTEYMLHRFLGHEHKGNNFFKDEHTVHHARSNYFAPAWKKGILAALVSSVLVAFIALISTFNVAISFVSGFTSMYIFYETTHARFHRKAPVARAFIVMRKHHFYHHFHNPRVNHGVTTRFWDRVFGTYRDVESVSVPRKMMMNWLVENDAIKAQYQRHFKLKG